VVPYLHVLSIAYFPQMVMHAVSHTLQMLDRQGLNAVWEVCRLVLISIVFASGHHFGWSAIFTITLYAFCQAGAELLGFGMMLQSIASLHQRHQAGKLRGILPAPAPRIADPGDRASSLPPDTGLPRVTVLIPAYNAADTLEIAVISVLRQTERSFELLIIDDASPDATLEVARRLEAAHPRIRVLAMEKNGGKVAAMNRGMAEAKGDWIAVLDADDWYAPERLEMMLDAADRAGVDIVADRWISVDAKAWVYLESPLPKSDHDLIMKLDSYLEGSRATAKADYGMLKPVVRRSFIERTGVSYLPNAKRGQDFYFLLLCFLVGGKALVMRDAYYYYVEPYGAVSRTWAQPGRQRYRFESMIQINDSFLDQYGWSMSRVQLEQLRRRSSGWRDLIEYHTLRECVLEGRMKDAWRVLSHSSPGFWSLFVHHGSVWVRSRLFGPSQRVLGPARNGGTLNDRDS
jgi:succinoglycan biosynthesis protein ExoO